MLCVNEELETSDCKICWFQDLLRSPFPPLLAPMFLQELIETQCSDCFPSLSFPIISVVQIDFFQHHLSKEWGFSLLTTVVLASDSYVVSAYTACNVGAPPPPS